jgi:hypothetical protein
MNYLKEAIAARDKFLEEHPHLQKFQNEITDLLDKVPEHQRLEVLHQLVLERMMEMQRQTNLLLGELENAKTKR